MRGLNEIQMTKESRFKTYLEPAIHILIWGSFLTANILFTQTLGPFRKENGSIYYPIIFGAVINASLFYFNALYLIPHYISKDKYRTYIFLVLVSYMSLTMVNSVADHFLFVALYSTEKEPFWSAMLTNSISKLFILSLSLGYGFATIMIRASRARQKLIEDKLNAELKILKAQIDPHFLFNTLNMAYASAIKNSDPKTADIVEKLAVLMRYVIYESNVENVSLEKDINYIENYIGLQLQRLSSDISGSIKCNIKGDWQGYQIAPMILIPFIENVFKHGIKLDEKSGIEINLNFQSGLLILETRNKLKINNVSIENSNTGIGLDNVKKRLQIIYPNRHKLEIETTRNIYHSRLELKL
jgi:two-component system, LytTR family, sensor kinase